MSKSLLIHCTHGKENAEKAILELYNLSGQLIVQSAVNLLTGSNNHQLNIKNIDNGIYILKVTSSEKTLETKNTKNVSYVQNVFIFAA